MNKRVFGGTLSSAPKHVENPPMDPVEHDRLFRDYLKNIKQPEAQAILDKLSDPNIRPGIYQMRSRTELEVPELWKRQLVERFVAKSKMWKYFRSRTTTSDRIIQPSLVGSGSSREVINKNGTKTTVVDDSYSQIVIPKRLKKFIAEDIEGDLVKDLNEYLLDELSTQMAQYVDSIVISLDENDEKNAMSSILTSNQVANHPSEGLKTVAGYITLDESETNPADAFMQAVKHLPQGYSGKAIWVMHTDTFKTVSNLKMTPTEDFPTDSPITTPEDGVDPEVLGKPVILNDSMPTSGLVAILGDFSRGYVVGNFTDMQLMFGVDLNMGQELAALQTYMAGQVLQPACFKLIKTK